MRNPAASSAVTSERIAKRASAHLKNGAPRLFSCFIEARMSQILPPYIRVDTVPFYFSFALIFAFASGLSALEAIRTGREGR